MTRLYYQLYLLLGAESTEQFEVHLASMETLSLAYILIEYYSETTLTIFDKAGSGNSRNDLQIYREIQFRTSQFSGILPVKLSLSHA